MAAAQFEMTVRRQRGSWPQAMRAIGSRGGCIELACVLRIESNPQGLITRIQIERDTIGIWVSSRCHEVLPKE